MPRAPERGPGLLGHADSLSFEENMEGCGDSPWVQTALEKILEGQGLSLQLDSPTRSMCRRNPARLSLGKGSLY